MSSGKFERSTNRTLMIEAKIISLSKSPVHSMSKANVPSINLLAGLGVEGDAHFGAKVKHRSRVAADPNQPNLRQVHLIHSELFVELADKGFQIHPGQIGENITTEGIDLLGLPLNTILTIGEAQIKVTGLRNPCRQLDDIQPGLMKAVLDRDKEGKLVRKAGIMGVVLADGCISVGTAIQIQFPPTPFVKLDRI